MSNEFIERIGPQRNVWKSLSLGKRFVTDGKVENRMLFLDCVKVFASRTSMFFFDRDDIEYELSFLQSKGMLAERLPW